jgi:hypothetical protein
MARDAGLFRPLPLGGDRQVKTWSANIDGLDPHGKDMHLRGIKQRKEANEVLRTVVNSIGAGSERWPRTIEQRFKELGDPLAYRTFYARMSSEVHGDAEEMLRYFIGRLSRPELFDRMALETVWTSRLYVHYAVFWFLRASITYSLRYRMTDAAECLRKEYLAVDTEIAEIAKHIGSGI